jgi:NADPH2:quinone reductase
MRAVGYYESLPITDFRSLVDFEAPLPEWGPHDLLVRVKAISVNPVDTKLRARLKPDGAGPRILGFDAAGVVEAIGSDVSRFKIGDQVFYAGSMDRQGCNAEWQAVDERLVGRKPRSLTFADAAALPLTGLTAWELLFDRFRIPYGPRSAGHAILVINGAGGVGSVLIQLARCLTGLTVIATASRPETETWCKGMGAHHVIDHRKPLNESLKAIGIPQVRYVAALTATDHHKDAIVECLAPQGALAIIDDPATFDIVPFKRKSISIHWEFMFTRPVFQTPDMEEHHRILTELSVLVESAKVRTTAREGYGTINAANLRAAHALLESGKSIGKITLSGF